MMLASSPLGFQVTDTYFVVHFHYVGFSTVVFAMVAGFYLWCPETTGRMLNERLGKLYFWTLFIGFDPTFLVQHWLGVEGMQRRIVDYVPPHGFTTLGWGRSLERATSSPPPRHNFTSTPPIRSDSPAFDLHHPEIPRRELEEYTPAKTPEEFDGTK